MQEELKNKDLFELKAKLSIPNKKLGYATIKIVFLISVL